MRLFISFILMVFYFTVYAAPLEVAITVDDLPVHMDLPPDTTRLEVTKQMLAAFDKHHIKNVYGFINAGKIENQPDRYATLQAWVEAGQLLGNHTYNHINLDKNTSAAFIEEIKLNEPYLIKLMANKDWHYFRYPYLYEGNTQEKRDSVRQYLLKNHYQIAQITVDFSDYLWNNPYARCVKKGDKKAIAWLKQSYIEHAINALTVAHELSLLLFNRDVKNILLLHIGAFDGIMLDDLLTAYEKNGVKIIPLTEAMQDSIYQVNPNIVEDDPFTFLNQMREAKHLPEPVKVTQLFASIPQKKLSRLCR